ncbi:hypothetical protein SAMN04489712_13227 [Thermomonospora echinospora]|uniref:ATP dependent DNA ligase domain-containing protein n=1 Tax=Thermomonospora echinospora TaxID=1992 RepID=A0A1H6E4B3_9ACTN|nr:hypothetical protein [Thermomonospora echinospora]SEG92109.1 hypothetical protein SAMN04489712_13227 [Thermomonospora echinospora]
MRKIPTIFVRDWDGDPKHVTSVRNPECAWVFAGEGIATRKYDGTCVMFDGERWWARREVKPGKATPAGFVLVEEDGETGKRVGWEPIAQSGFAKFHAEALAAADRPGEAPSVWAPGTYELCGPKINRNPERAETHVLIRHALAERVEVPSPTFDGICEVVRRLAAEAGAEGIVWHHPDGRMAKIKARDFPGNGH